MESVKGEFVTFDVQAPKRQLELALDVQPQSGRFITFEGGEGTGKSTQMKMLSSWLQSHQVNNLMTKEPGGTEAGVELRKMLVCGDKDKFDAVAEALLYYADRRIHLTTKIWPALQKGTWVLSDRFADSTVAYQYYGYNQKVPYETLQNLYQIAVGNFKPDLTIVLDLDPKIGIERSFKKAMGMTIKETRFESMDLSFHQNLRNGFLQIAAAEPQRCVVLNADKSIEDLHRDILNVVSERFKLS